MEKWRVLLITAHPDDETSCGGTLAKLADAGHEITVAVATSGNRGTQDPSIRPDQLAQIREREMQEASYILGVHKLIGLGYDDGTLADQAGLKEHLYRLIRSERPDIVITLDAWRKYEFHPDHRALGLAATEAAYLADGCWYYPEHAEEGLKPWKPQEVYLIWSDDPNYSVDVCATWERKLLAADAHVSQSSGGRTFRENFVNWITLRAPGGEVQKEESFRKIYGTSLNI
ncbi:PIG-L deacetylase family protein [Paenibacillus beijingensis]|uniref:PIG-L deacetylase family protein n=1 Tax=Paenibacillus beijingensis TaxID=1126833 RepID=UPI000698BA48|nr:PIG-L deacetylase family protein [Paenibacillus beijingensis]